MMVATAQAALGDAIAIRSKSSLSRIVIMAVIAALLWQFSAWRWAPVWWSLYCALQLALVRLDAADAAEGAHARRWVYLLSFASYAVSGFPCWHMWRNAGDLGIAASTMFLCGMLVQLVVSSLGARRLFWVSAAPLIGYLTLIPPLAFGAERLAQGVAAMICALLFTGYLAKLWLAQQRALEAMDEARVRAEELQRDAEAANRAKTDFLAVMSHEIRTPMNAVLGAADLLKRSRLDAGQTEHVEMLAAASQSLMQILNDVLDLSKIEAGKLAIDMTPTDVQAFVRRCAAVWAPRAQDKGLTFHFSIAADAPQHVLMDATRVGQIVFNLLSNAVKFTTSGSISLRLDVEPLTDETCRLKFEVVDTGIGIAPGVAARLFTAFEQADNSISRRFGGTGLGLSISRKIADMMEGDIEVASEEGQGSTFTLALPCRYAAAPRDAEDCPEVDEAPSEPLVSRRILLAEDNPANQRIVELFLAPIGASLTVANNGLEAVAAANSGQRFDVILMDIQMPVMDGIEAARRIRTGGVNATTPMFALTANVLQHAEDEALIAGMNGIIAKPIDARQLISTVLGAGDPSFDRRHIAPELAATAV